MPVLKVVRPTRMLWEQNQINVDPSVVATITEAPPIDQKLSYNSKCTEDNLYCAVTFKQPICSHVEIIDGKVNKVMADAIIVKGDIKSISELLGLDLNQNN